MNLAYDIFQPTTDGVPTFSMVEISKLAKSHYGLDGKVSPLPSYYDQNFLLETITGKYIIKIANCSRNLECVLLENKILEKLYISGFKVQIIVPTKNNESSIVVKHRNDLKFTIRLLSYLPGITLSSINNLRPSVLADLGVTTAKLDVKLSEFEYINTVNSIWDLKNATYVLKWIDYLPNPEIKETINNLIDRFERNLSLNSGKLTKSLIHGDLNLANLLMLKASSKKVVGIIDFGELKYTYRIFDLAIACMYVGLNKNNPLEEFSKVVSGYNTILPLTEVELETLFPAICTRICVSTIISHKNSSESPNNRYVSSKCKPNIDLLLKVKDIEPKYAIKFFKKISTDFLG